MSPADGPRRPAPAAALEVCALVAVGAAAVALSWRLLHTAANYDEGVYLAATDALRHGQALGSQVFAAQLPGFYDLLRGLSAVAGLTVDRMRAAMLFTYTTGVVGAWLIGRRYGGLRGGALTAGLFIVAPPLDLFAPDVLADPPSLALSILAVGLATIEGPIAAVCAGLVICAAVSVKLTAITAIPALLWFLRRRVVAAAAGAAALAAVLLAAHAHALGSLWASGVTYHVRARSTPAVIPHPYRQIFEQMPARTPFVWFAIAALVAAVIATALRRLRVQVWPLWLWLALAWGFLLLQQPLHPNHLILVPGTLAIAAGATLAAMLPRHTAVYAAVGVVLAAAYVQQWHRVDVAYAPEPASNVAAAHALARLTTGRMLVVDDRPIISFLAGRRVVGPLVDLALLRFETKSLTQAAVERDLAGAGAVVVSRQLRDEPRVLAYVRARFTKRYDAGGVVVYVRRDS